MRINLHTILYSRIHLTILLCFSCRKHVFWGNNYFWKCHLSHCNDINLGELIKNNKIKWKFALLHKIGWWYRHYFIICLLSAVYIWSNRAREDNRIFDTWATILRTQYHVWKYWNCFSFLYLMKYEKKLLHCNNFTESF